ncbi:MAG: Glucokinase [candidate division BRC1 bacterium ADurb.BinA364]|nr:MAG: Glucokinase [candidate division BRC1 bacterium ADurb.BinA364]
MSGEIGHATMDPASEAVCECGNRGCLEALSSGHAIATAARQALAAGEPSALACPGMAAAEISAERVAQAAAQGDALAQRIFRQAAERIGLAIACMMSVFNPEAVFIGGGVARAGDLLFDPIRRVVEQRAIDRVRHGVAILPASHGSRSAAVGALALILNEILHLNIPACREG